MCRVLEHPKTDRVCWQAKKAWAALNTEAGKLEHLPKLGSLPFQLAWNVHLNFILNWGVNQELKLISIGPRITHLMSHWFLWSDREEKPVVIYWTFQGLCSICSLLDYSSSTIHKQNPIINSSTFNAFSLVLVAQTCPTLCNPMNCSPPSFSVCEIFQTRILEWITISFSRGYSWPRDWTPVSWIAGIFFTVWATGKIQFKFMFHNSCFSPV